MHKSVTDLKTLFAISALTVAVAACDSSSSDGESSGTDTNNIPAWVNGPSLTSSQKNVSTSYIGTGQLYADDFDADGDADFFWNKTNDWVTAMFNDGAGNFTSASLGGFDENVNRVVTAGDIDGDGDKDFVSITRSTGSIYWRENLGDGAFDTVNEVVIYSSGPTYADAIFVDYFNDDEHLDILVGGDYDVYYFEGNGDTTFTGTEIIGGNESGDFHVADIDGDGFKDYLIQSYNGGYLYWVSNDGSGGFSGTAVTTTDDYVFFRALDAADVDSDGDTDVLGGYSGSVVWYENDGNENFTENLVTDALNDVRHLYATDLDNDGDVDLVVGDYETGVVSWYENDGNQNFSQNVLTDEYEQVRALQVADFNGDGFSDVLYCAVSNSDEVIAWFEMSLAEKVDVFENETFVVLSEATDVDTDQTLSYSIIGGDDSALFEIDASGSVSFLAGKTIVNPEDADGDNVYEVVIAATDGFDTIEKEIHVTVLAAE